MSDFMVPDMIEPIVAWRVWRVNFNGLNSLNHEMAWPYRKRAEARCRHSEPSTRSVAGWEAVSSTGETSWLRDALEGEHLQAPYFPSGAVYGMTGPTGPAPMYYHPTPVAYSAVTTHISTVPSEPVEIATEPSGLILPTGWEWRIGYRKEQYPPEHTTPPGEDCACGIYALKSRDMNSHYLSGADAWGEVYLWGKYVEGDFGYRAQYAYPKSIAVKGGHGHLEEYGVPFEQEGAVQVAISRALPTGPNRKAIRIAMLVNFTALAINVLIATLGGGFSVWSAAAVSMSMLGIILLVTFSVLMAR